MKWPFERRAGRYPPASSGETAGSTSRTDEVIDALLARAAGSSKDPEALAVAEAAVSLWERSLASATVEPRGGRLAGLTPGMMALIGRTLAVRGNLVARITVEGSAVRLWPAADFDVTGDADPDSWVYRLNLPGPSATHTVLVPAAGVVHFRTGAGASTPWRGVAPLARAQSTAALAGAVEYALTREMVIPPGRLALAHGGGKVADILRWLKQGGFAVAGDAANRGIQPEPTQRHRPVTYGPEPAETVEALRTDTGRDVLAAFGIPPALFAERGDGAGQREAWRRLWLGTIQPLAVQIQAEVRAKLEAGATFHLDALRAGDEDGRSRAVMRRASAFKTLVDTGMDRDEARRLAGLGV